MALWILCSHLWDCGRWSPFNTHTHTVLLTMPQTWEQLPRTILGQRAPLLCVCMRGRQTERNDHKELAQIPRPVVDKGATLEGWWYSFSLRAGRWRHGGPNVLVKFEIRKKKKKCPSLRAVGVKEFPFISIASMFCPTEIFNLLGEVKSFRRVWLFATPWTVAPQAPLSMGFSGKNTGVGCHFLLQGIFLAQGLDPGLPHCRQTL